MATLALSALVAGCDTDNATIIGLYGGSPFWIVVHPDGRASISGSHRVAHDFRIPRELAKSFLRVAAAARADHFRPGACDPKLPLDSAVWVSYRGWVSSDLACTTDSMDEHVVIDVSTLNNMARTIIVARDTP